MRAKFRCASIKFFGDAEDANTPREYELWAVYDSATEENRRFARATPTGNMTIRVDNPNARLEVGEEYYLDFTPTALAQHQKTPETMGNTHDAGVYTREGGYRGADREPGLESGQYGNQAAAYQPQHGGHPDPVTAPATPDAPVSTGYVIPDAEPEKTQHSER